ncbi:MAG: ABC transporter permease [Candidatus Krumholzibacteriia bacterium]
MNSLARSIGRLVFGYLAITGRGTMLLVDILRQLPATWHMRRETLEQMNVVAVGSLPLVITTAVFVGAVTAVQAVYQMQAYVPMVFLGTIISKSVFIELGPVLTALVVGGRLTANYAAELGTMKVTEQLDAMEIMAIEPVRYLALPRFLAAVLMLPVITVFANAIAVTGGFLVSILTLDITASTFVEGLRMFWKPSDLISGLLKSYIFGGIIAMSGIYFGMATSGGAEGVGKNTMAAVVASCLSVLVADYLLAALLFQVIFE